MYRSKLSFETYLTTLFALLFIYGAIFCFSHPQITLKGKTSGEETSIVFLGFFSIVFFALIIYPVGKRTALIFVGKDTLILQYFFKRVSLKAGQIKSVELFARKGATFFDPESKLNGIKINNNGDSYFFPDKYIGSKSTLKQKIELFCNENNIELIPFFGSNTKKIVPDSFEKQTFAGNYLTSFNGISCFVMIVFIWSMPLWIPISKANSPHNLLLSGIGFTFLWIVIFSIQSNYFIGENNKLIVKNHLAFWKNKQFDLEDILCATFESRQKASTSLRIVFKNYSSKRYFAGSLRDKHWEALKDYLESNDIPVIADVLF